MACLTSGILYKFVTVVIITIPPVIYIQLVVRVVSYQENNHIIKTYFNYLFFSNNVSQIQCIDIYLNIIALLLQTAWLSTPSK